MLPEAPTLVPGLYDLALVRETVERGCRGTVEVFPRGEMFHANGTHAASGDVQVTNLQAVENIIRATKTIGCLVSAPGTFGHYWSRLLDHAGIDSVSD